MPSLTVSPYLLVLCLSIGCVVVLCIDAAGYPLWLAVLLLLSLEFLLARQVVRSLALLPSEGSHLLHRELLVNKVALPSCEQHSWFLSNATTCAHTSMTGHHCCLFGEHWLQFIEFSQVAEGSLKVKWPHHGAIARALIVLIL